MSHPAGPIVYDELQRLRSSSRTWAGAGVTIPPEAETYTYDDLGNILTKSNYGTPYTYGTLARAAGNAGPHAVRTVKKLDTTTATFTYDLNGNLMDGDGRHVDFDLMDRPSSVCSSTTGNCLQTAVQTDFLYGPDGSRYLQKVVTPGDTRYGSKTVYYVDKDYELVVWAPTAAMPAGSLEERSYLGSSVVVYRRDAAPKEIRYQTFDRLGSVEAVTKDEPAVNLLSLDVHGFDAFGKPRTGLWTSSGDLLHPGGDLGATTDRGFTGHEHLDANFLIHMNGRVYDYRLGRFLSVDPIISNPANSQSINPYSYIGNNPLSGTDPTGYWGACSVSKGGYSCSWGKDEDPNASGNRGQGQAAPATNGNTGNKNGQECKVPMACGGPQETGQQADQKSETNWRSFAKGFVIGVLNAFLPGTSQLGLPAGLSGDPDAVAGQGIGQLATGIVQAKVATDMTVGGAVGGVVTSETGVGAMAGATVSAGGLVLGGVAAGNVAQGGETLGRAMEMRGSGSGSSGGDGRGAGPVLKTTADAAKVAEGLGFQRIPETSHGQAIFTDGKRFITRDIDSHSGGAWKMADSPGGLSSKATRFGTYDINLNRIGP